MFQISDTWKSSYPTAHAGILVMRGVKNPPRNGKLKELKAALEAELRARYSSRYREILLTHPILQAYETYYRKFDKTYHVQLQLESILFKGKSIPNMAALVEAMFMAELDNLLLTAGHDLDEINPPLTLDIAKGDESYTLLHGKPQSPKAGDMLITDDRGIISSIMYGPDDRTQISARTKNVIFTVYAPDGVSVDAITKHLQDIQRYVQVIAPNATVELSKVFGAD